MNAAPIIAVIFVFVLIKHAMDTRAKQDRERLRLIEEALRQGDLDDKSREELMGTLTGRRPQPDRAHPVRVPSPHEVGFFLKFLAFVGWLGGCVGISFFLVDANVRGYEFLVLPAIILSCAGFALVTFPFVVRELTSERRGVAAEQRT